MGLAIPGNKLYEKDWILEGSWGSEVNCALTL